MQDGISSDAPRSLADRKGRIAKKLRISVTDRCNFACLFCMPDREKVRWLPQEDILSFDEIERVARVLASLGIEKIRITGGEPLLRPRVEDLIAGLSKINRIRSISMTTNGLFLADSIGTAMKTEFNAVTWWDMRNGQDTANNNSSSLYGWRLYGDYGIVNGANPAGPADRYPTFYVAKLLQYFARGGDLLVPASSDYSLLTPYAARRANGSLTLLVINKSAAAALNANITVNGYSPNSALSAYSYGIPQDEAARTGVGSADIASNSYTGVGSTFAFTFPAYAATVLALNGAQPPPATHQPDNLIKTGSESTYLGDNVYNTDGTGQTKSQSVKAGRNTAFNIMIQNDGSATDSFTVQANGSSTGFTVKYYTGTSGGTDITAAVTAGTYAISNLGPGANQVIRAVVTVARGTPSSAVKDCLVTSTSIGDNLKSDAVKARVTVN